MSLYGLSSEVFVLSLILGTALIVVLHFLRIKPREIIIPFVYLWKETEKEAKPRILIKKLSRLFSLMLMLLIFFILLVSAGEPGPSIGKIPIEGIVIDPLLFKNKETKEFILSRLEEIKPFSQSGARRFVVLSTVPEIVIGSSYDSPFMLMQVGDIKLEKIYDKSEYPVLNLLETLKNNKNSRIRIFWADPEEIKKNVNNAYNGPALFEPIPLPFYDDCISFGAPVYLSEGRWGIVIKAKRKGRGGEVRQIFIEKKGIRIGEGYISDNKKEERITILNLNPGDEIKARLKGKDAFPENDFVKIIIPRRNGIKVLLKDKMRRVEAAVRAEEAFIITKRTSDADVLVGYESNKSNYPKKYPSLLFKNSQKKIDSSSCTWRAISDHWVVSGFEFRDFGMPYNLVDIPKTRKEILAECKDKPCIVLEKNYPERLYIFTDPEKNQKIAYSEEFPVLIKRSLFFLSGIPLFDSSAYPGDFVEIKKNGDVAEFKIKELGITLKTHLFGGSGIIPFIPDSEISIGKSSFHIPPHLRSFAREKDEPANLPKQEELYNGILPFYLLILGILAFFAEWILFTKGRIP